MMRRGGGAPTVCINLVYPPTILAIVEHSHHRGTKDKMADTTRSKVVPVLESLFETLYPTMSSLLHTLAHELS
jgi:hypothetical protein